jgi:hypothetical protein
MARRSGSFRCLVPYNAVVSGDGRPFLGHVATVISTGIDKTSPQDFRCPGLPLPYKRVGRALQRNEEKNPGQALQDSPHRDQHLKQSSLYFSFPLRPGLAALSRKLVTPTQAPRCKEIYNSLPPLDVGLPSARTRINPRVFSLHHHPG